MKTHAFSIIAVVLLGTTTTLFAQEAAKVVKPDPSTGLGIEATTVTADDAKDATTSALTSASISENETEREAAPPEPKTWVDDYDALLQKYVTPTGVKYKAWHGSSSDRAALGKVINKIATQNVSTMEKEEKLAFYLNAYNAWILHRILQDYPTDGPGGGGFFGRNRFFKSDALKVAGSRISFTDLENEIIRPKFKEPRIHFALNCASRSCPPLNAEAFRKETLDTTLTRLATAFVNDNPNGVQVVKGGKKVLLSKIFDWYEDDFAGGQVAYINKFRKSKLSGKARVSFQDYHWTLNEAR